MYEIDQDLKKHFNKEDLKKNKRVPKFPSVDGAFECTLNRVAKKESDGMGRVYEFLLRVDKSSNPLVLDGKDYTIAYFPKASKRDIETFWKLITPILMAVKGETDIDNFEPCETLAELEGICRDDESLELGLSFRLNCKLEPARKDKKTGKYDPKHLDDEGKPKIFRQDDFSPASAPAA